MSIINILTLTFLLTSSVSAALCPSFTLTADAPGEEWDGQKIIASGYSTYVSSEAPIAPDAYATFFRNDTTRLWATGFNVSYSPSNLFETPPFRFIATNDGGLTVFSNSSGNNIVDVWTAEAFNVTEDGYVGFVPEGPGLAGNTSSIGGWLVCYTPAPVVTGGVAQVAEVVLGVIGIPQDDGCVETLFKMTDVNVTAANYC